MWLLSTVVTLFVLQTAFADESIVSNAEIYEKLLFVRNHSHHFHFGSLKQLPIRKFDAFLNNQSLFVGSYHGANLQQQWGNKMAVYFEAVACADIAGHHFVTGTRFDPHDKLVHGFPVVIPHPDPLPSGEESTALFRRSCPNLIPYPFVKAGAWNQRPLLLRKLINNAIQQAYPDADSSVLPLNTFDYLNNKSFLLEPSLPLIPDVAILFRCKDILRGTGRLYGFLNWNVYRLLLKHIKPKTIYILSEPLDYLSSSSNSSASVNCRHISTAMVDYLTELHPSALVAVRRGHAYDSVVMLARAKIVISAPSTFTVWPGLANPNKVFFHPGNVIEFQPFLSETFYWIPYPTAIRLGRYVNENNVSAHIRAVEVLKTTFNESEFEFQNSFAVSRSD
jgi:hypothetical protein